MLLWLALHYLIYALNWQILVNLDWKLEVQELALIREQLHREEDIKESALNRMKISNWL